MYRNAEDVANDLAVPYSGPTKEKGGYTYIPAAESRNALDRIFGPLGWSESDPHIEINPENGVYAAALTITAHVVDEDGTVREISRVGFGRSIAQATGQEREQGLTVTKNLQLHDVAAAAMGTDAFSRACKRFGPALGSDLYLDTAENTTRTSTSSTPRASTGKGPSDKQRGVLKGLGFDDEQIDGMPFATWKEHLDKHFASKNNSQAPF